MASAKQQRERQKSTRFDACSQVDRQRAFLTIATPAFVFLWLFNGKFSMILSDFCIHGVRKATPVTTKANAFWCNFAGRSTACVFEHCTIGIYVFSCSFRGDLWCILASFCMILSSRLEAWSRYMNGPRSNSKRVIFITFWSVFALEKYSYPWRLVDFWKISIKLGRKTMIHFRAICTRVSCFLTFSCDLEKNVIRGTICEWAEYNLGFQRPPKNDQKMTLPRV